MVGKNRRLRAAGEPIQRMNGKLRAVPFPADFEKGKLEIEFVFNDAGRVAGLLLNRRR